MPKHNFYKKMKSLPCTWLLTTGMQQPGHALQLRSLALSGLVCNAKCMKYMHEVHAW